MTAYYNEIDPYAAAWLRNLIAAGHIAPGDVDERDIRDVRPDDLRGYQQCHFFAGVGVWSYALRRAGWADDRPVWTGSCPCQPFSQAGAGLAFADERHLWPHFHWLISECRPSVILGEQVASKDADLWIDLVQDDLEAMDYAFGAVPFPTASVTMDYGESELGRQTLAWIEWALDGCPDPELASLLRSFADEPGGAFGVGPSNIRDRLYWVANTKRRAAERYGHEVGSQARRMRSSAWQQRVRNDAGNGFHASGLAHTSSERFDGERLRIQPRRSYETHLEDGRSSEVGRLADAECHAGGRKAEDAHNLRQEADGRANRPSGCSGAFGSGSRTIDGFWRDADWLLCRDGKLRPVEPGTFPLVDGAPARVGRLRAYGNAINAEAAVAWIEVVMESLP